MKSFTYGYICTLLLVATHNMQAMKSGLTRQLLKSSVSSNHARITRWAGLTETAKREHSFDSGSFALGAAMGSSLDSDDEVKSRPPYGLYKEFFNILVLKEESPNEFENLIKMQRKKYAAILKVESVNDLKENRRKQKSWFTFKENQPKLVEEEAAISNQIATYEKFINE